MEIELDLLLRLILGRIAGSGQASSRDSSRNMREGGHAGIATKALMQSIIEHTLIIHIDEKEKRKVTKGLRIFSV